MRIAPRREALPSPKQAQLGIGVEASMPHPASEEKILARNPIAAECDGVIGNRPNLFGELGAYLLIGVESQHPGLGAMLKRIVFLSHVSTPGLDENLGVIAAGDLAGAVGRPRIHQYNLICPAHAFERAADVLFFIQSDDSN